MTSDQRAALDAFWDHASDWVRVRFPELAMYVLAWAAEDERRTVERETRDVLAYLASHMELLNDADAHALFGELQDIEERYAERAGDTPWAEWARN